ncbi:MAG: preprotein translocase subunit YajC [Selenomonadaceae bacterium]|nr:preprotein translocase subunit YajC [Selenomonadaceae bacterium]
MGNDLMAAFATWAPILFMILIFYFLLYRPQQQAKKAREEMLGSLKVGTKIITAGGIYGVITKLDTEILKVQIADKVEIEITRGAVGNIAPEKNPKVDDDDDDL